MDCGSQIVQVVVGLQSHVGNTEEIGFSAWHYEDVFFLKLPEKHVAIAVYEETCNSIAGALGRNLPTIFLAQASEIQSLVVTFRYYLSDTLGRVAQHTLMNLHKKRCGRKVGSYG